MYLKKPELVAPAGNLEKAEAAFIYGADAVYLGGTEFSLRALADNFTHEQMETVVEMAHQQGKKVYVTVNIIAHNHDLPRLPAYLQELEKLGVDGLIVSDLGVMRMAVEYAPSLPITVSTQASVANYAAARAYRDLGARRIVLAREVSWDGIKEICEKADVEVEVFIHGAMCVSYSGRCLLSSFMTGRSGNRGECAHPCRYRYYLREEKRPGEYFPIMEDERGTYILNSRDLYLLDHVAGLMEVGVDAFKIEGRMKSVHYVATTTRVYRQAIDAAAAGRSEAGKGDGHEELGKIATRPYTTGFLLGPPQPGQDVDKDKRALPVAFCGIVREYAPARGMALVEQRNPFGPGDMVEFLFPDGTPTWRYEIKNLYDMEMNPVDRARHAQQLVWLPVSIPLPYFTLLRRVDDNAS